MNLSQIQSESELELMNWYIARLQSHSVSSLRRQALLHFLLCSCLVFPCLALPSFSCSCSCSWSCSVSCCCCCFCSYSCGYYTWLLPSTRGCKHKCFYICLYVFYRVVFVFVKLHLSRAALCSASTNNNNNSKCKLPSLFLLFIF